MPVASGSIAYLGAARFKGYWNASSNAASGSGLPAEPQGTFSSLLIDGGYNAGTNLTASAGDYWQVTASGTTSVNGQASWGNNDWCIYSASAGGTGTWRKLAFEDTIASIVIGDLSSSSFHMGAQYDKHVVFTSGSNALHGVDNFTFDYTSNTLNLTGTMHVSGAGITLVGPEAGAVALTLKADQGDDAADTTTITVVDGGSTTIATGADLTLDPAGGDVIVDGDLSPGSDSADSLGRPGVAWSTLYVDNVDLDGQGRIDLDNNQDTSIRASADDTIKIEVGASDLVTIDAAGIALTGQVSGSGRGIFVGSLMTAGPMNVSGTAVFANNVSSSAKGIFVDELRTAGDLNVTGNANIIGRATIGTQLIIPDNIMIALGNSTDGAILYDEANVDKLIISGAAGGFDIDLPDNVADAFSIREEGTPYLTIMTSNSAEAVLLSQDAWLIDDKKLYFGTGKDSSIEYDEDDQNFLIISGSSRGTVLSGTIVAVAGTLQLSDASGIPASNGGLAAAGGTLVVSGSAIADGTIAVASDEMVFLDADGSLKRETIADLATAIAGTGLNASGGQLGLYFAEIAAVTPVTSTDSVMILDNGSGTKRVTVTTMGDYLVGTSGGLANTAGVLNVSSSAVADATVAVASDTIMFFDMPSGVVKQESIADLVSGIASTGLDASSGQLTVDVSDFLTNGVDNRLVTATGADALNAEANLTYDGTTFVIGDDARVNDDLPLYFGSNSDASIFYDEAGQDMLIISGSSFGTTLSGSLIRVTDKLSIGVDTSPAKTSGILLVSADADDTTNGLIATFKSGDSDYGRINIDNSTANGDTQFTFMSNGSSKWSIGNMGSDETLHIKSGFGSFTDSDPFILSNSGFDFNSPITASQHVRVEDGKKLYFGTGNDASVEYDEAGVDKLIISGAAGGFDIDLPDNVANAFSIMEEANAYVTVITTNSSEAVMFSQDAWLIDDKKLHLGTNKDASIEYDEDDQNLLIISGSSRGMVLSGSNINIGGTRNMFTTTTKIGGKVGINDFDPKVALSVTNNFQAVTFENQLADGEGGGERLIYSPGANDTLTAGQIYFLHTDGTWDSTDADAVATGASQLLGVGLGGGSQAVGVHTKGFIKIPSTEILNLPGSGACDGLPVYVSTTAGHFDFTAPSGTGDFVRIVGYAVDDDSSDVLVYFDPDKTWIEVA